MKTREADSQICLKCGHEDFEDEMYYCSKCIGYYCESCKKVGEEEATHNNYVKLLLLCPNDHNLGSEWFVPESFKQQFEKQEDTTNEEF